MSNKALYRITEQDVHLIIENSVRRILREFYDSKNVAQLWNEVVEMLGAQEFVSIIEDGWDMNEIYSELVDKTGMDEEELDAAPYEEIASLMGEYLDTNFKYELLNFLSEETGQFSVDDVTDAPQQVTIDQFNDFDNEAGDEVSSEEEVEVEDDEEYEDPEFRGMNDLD